MWEGKGCTYLIPLTNALSATLLEEALVVGNAVLTVDKAVVSQ